MNELQEERYRKWLGICQQTSTYPLTLTRVEEEIRISVNGKLLFKATRDEYDGMTANEIVKQIGVIDNE